MIVIINKIWYYSFMENMTETFAEILETIEKEYDELQELVLAVEIMSDHKLYNHYLKKIKKIEIIANNYKKYKGLIKDIASLDDEFEIGEFQSEAENLLNQIKNDYQSFREEKEECVQIEICSKDDVEFKNQLVGVFKNYAINNGFEFNDISGSDTAKFEIVGGNVHKQLNLFSGKVKKILCGKEVQASIVVLKKDNFDIEIKDEDLLIQTSKSSGAGGQHINKTESAVKIIHLPTGIFAECQDERSQTKNKEKAVAWLIEKIAQKSKEKAEKQEKNQRKNLKNKLFASTPVVVFDFDLNKVFVTSERNEYKLKDILEGRLEQIIHNQI